MQINFILGMVGNQSSFQMETEDSVKFFPVLSDSGGEIEFSYTSLGWSSAHPSHFFPSISLAFSSSSSPPSMQL